MLTRFSFLFWLLFLGPGLLPSTFAKAPFERVLVMTGQGFNTPALVGVVDGLEEAGERPDVIVAGCGAAYAATLIHAIPDLHERRKYLASEPYHRLLRRISINADRARYGTMLASFAQATKRNTDAAGKLAPNGKLPDLFGTTLLDVPQDLGEDSPLDRGFGAETGNTEPIRIVILCAKVGFGKTDAGTSVEAWKKEHQNTPYRIVLQTDADTARFLDDYRSPIAEKYENRVRLAAQPTIATNRSLAQAARASIADPFLISPQCSGNDYYVTGAVDHYPVELAQHLGEKIFMVYASRFSQAERIYYADAFGFDIYERQDSAWEASVDHWIDFSDADSVLGDANSLQLKIDANPFASRTVSLRVPKTYGDDFKRRIAFQLGYGAARARESAATAPESLDHIRKPAHRSGR